MNFSSKLGRYTINVPAGMYLLSVWSFTLNGHFDQWSGDSGGQVYFWALICSTTEDPFININTPCYQTAGGGQLNGGSYSNKAVTISFDQGFSTSTTVYLAFQINRFEHTIILGNKYCDFYNSNYYLSLNQYLIHYILKIFKHYILIK